MNTMKDIIEAKENLEESISRGAVDKLADNMINNPRTMKMLERYGIEASEDITRLKDALIVFIERFFRRS